MSMPTIEITQPTLPSPLPTDQQELMNLFYGHWQALATKVRDNNRSLDERCDEIFASPSIPGMLRSPHQSEIAAVMPPKIVAAVVLGNHNQQVGNGGWLQWDGNGYSESVDGLRILYEGGAALGIEDADKVLAMIDEFIQRKADDESHRPGCHANDDEDMDEGDTFGDLDTRFYALDTEALMQKILDRFDEIMARSFLANTFRMAA